MNKDEHVYFWVRTCSDEGLGSYCLCKEIEEEKATIEEYGKRYKEIFFRDFYPYIEACQKNAAHWVNIIRSFFDEYGMKRIGLVWYFGPDSIDDFPTFPTDETKLEDLNAEVIMKFQREFIHCIVK